MVPGDIVLCGDGVLSVSLAVFGMPEVSGAEVVQGMSVVLLVDRGLVDSGFRLVPASVEGMKASVGVVSVSSGKVEGKVVWGKLVPAWVEDKSRVVVPPESVVAAWLGNVDGEEYVIFLVFVGGRGSVDRKVVSTVTAVVSRVSPREREVSVAEVTASVSVI